MKKKTVEEEIDQFLTYFDGDKIIKFLYDVIPLFELYDVEDEDDWVRDAVGEEDERNVRIIRTVYIMSKIADNHAGILSTLRLNHPRLWKRMREHSGFQD